jgi:hypothetical protein
MTYPKIIPGYVMVKVEMATICIEHQVHNIFTNSSVRRVMS